MSGESLVDEHLEITDGHGCDLIWRVTFHGRIDDFDHFDDFGPHARDVLAGAPTSMNEPACGLPWRYAVTKTG